MGTASDELLKAAKDCADEAGVVFHQHEGYTPAASDADRAKLGKSRIAHLASLGALGSNCVLIHMNVWDDADRELLAASNTSVVWCPLGYLQLAISNQLGCRMPYIMESGIPVSIGTDGAMDFTVGSAGQAAFMLATSIGRPITPAKVIEMQTIEAARAAGLADRIGSIEAGKRADIVIRTRDAAESYPAVNPVHQLALTARAGTVDVVLVDGKIVFKGGKSTVLDELQVCAEAQASVRRRMERLGLAPLRYWS
jgi:5-methylthioadenosine/S-adenosylhomocysteine deaminase